MWIEHDAGPVLEPSRSSHSDREATEINRDEQCVSNVLGGFIRRLSTHMPPELQALAPRACRCHQHSMRFQHDAAPLLQPAPPLLAGGPSVTHWPFWALSIALVAVKLHVSHSQQHVSHSQQA